MGSHLKTYSYHLCCWRKYLFHIHFGQFLFLLLILLFKKHTEGMFHRLSEDIQEFQIL